MVMSQNVQEKSNPKNTPTSEQQKEKAPPVTDASPDDPIGITVGGTGKPGHRER
jgi:hypothetical protein